MSIKKCLHPLNYTSIIPFTGRKFEVFFKNVGVNVALQLKNVAHNAIILICKKTKYEEI